MFMQREDEVQFASEADLRNAVDHSLERAGVSLEELARQAKQGRFSSERARLAWFMASPVAHSI
jgi:hypothetical protein